MWNYGNERFKNMEKKTKKILIFGEKAEKSSPSLTLLNLLLAHGYIAECNDLPDNSLNCLKFFSEYDIAFFIFYKKPSDWLIKKIALANFVNTKIYRYWVGSDVLLACENLDWLPNIKKLDKFITKNITVAFHLSEELLTIGIESCTVPLVPSSYPPICNRWSQEISRSILVYLPKGRESFYGGEILESLFLKNKNFKFIVVANDSDKYQTYNNVESYGWIEDMESIYSRVGSVLRITRHDGLPRMILESLARGRYVIYSWPLEGCYFAGKLDEISACLDDIKNKNSYNVSGSEYVRSEYSSKKSMEKLSVALKNNNVSKMKKTIRSCYLLASLVLEKIIKKSSYNR